MAEAMLGPALVLTVVLALAGCAGGGLSDDERRRADSALASIRAFCGTAGGTVLAHGGLSPAEDRRLHASRNGVRTLIDLYEHKPDATYDPPGAARPVSLRVLLDRLARQLRFCDIQATDAIVRALS